MLINTIRIISVHIIIYIIIINFFTMSSESLNNLFLLKKHGIHISSPNPAASMIGMRNKYIIFIYLLPPSIIYSCQEKINTKIKKSRKTIFWIFLLLFIPDCWHILKISGCIEKGNRLQDSWHILSCIYHKIWYPTYPRELSHTPADVPQTAQTALYSYFLSGLWYFPSFYQG